LAEITTAMVKELRDKTGAGVMDCRRALEEADGDLAKAEEVLRARGAATAAKKAGRAANQGIVEPYIHLGGRIGALVELNCETDFVARNPEFKALARELAMQVAAMSPRYVEAGEIPAETVAEYGGDARRAAEELALLDQPFIRTPNRQVRDLVNDAIGKIGENIVVRRFVRFEVGTAENA
jgi:elongation factor Ts